MALSSGNVVAVFGVKYEAFQVEYHDGDEWVLAVGEWPSSVRVESFYRERRLAEQVAKYLSQAEGKPFRVVQVEQEED